MKVYIGYDSREVEREAYAVARRSAERWGCDVVPLYEDRLRAAGLLTRTTDRRAVMYREQQDAPYRASGMWDFNSSAGQATEFAISRFFVPLLAHAGWCLFADADVVFMQNPHELLALADDAKALHCVKHSPADLGEAVATKMDGQVQTQYRRKLWSSVVLWNCDHPANRRLNLTTLNQWPGRDLHAFAWLADSEIGDLPREANWLVGMQPKPARPIVAHYTLGTPNMPGHAADDHAEIWITESQR
jgi:hypothetical protein